MVCCFVKEHINKGRACSFMSFKCFWRASTMSSTLFGVGGRDMSHFLMDTPHIRIPLKGCQVFFFLPLNLHVFAKASEGFPLSIILKYFLIYCQIFPALVLKNYYLVKKKNIPMQRFSALVWIFFSAVQNRCLVFGTSESNSTLWFH